MLSQRSMLLLVAVLLAGPVSAQTGAGAFWRSLLIPGWGQHYAHGGGGRFIVAEGALWIGHTVFNRLAAVRADRFHAYAAEHAGASSRGRGRRFLDDLGFYQSRIQHNQFALRSEGPNAELYGMDGFDWEWDGEDARERYRSIRNDSQLAKRQALYATGLIVANHLLSAIHAARSVANDAPSSDAVSLQIGPIDGGVYGALLRRF